MGCGGARNGEAGRKISLGLRLGFVDLNLARFHGEFEDLHVIASTLMG